jgi:AcrR family transcriptional regulator
MAPGPLAQAPVQQTRVQQTRTDAVRERAMEGLADVLDAGRPLTFKEVAAASGIPERTLYRYFPTREELLAGAYAWANRRIGFEGAPPTDASGATDLVRRAFPGFDDIAGVVRELLAAPEGLAARVADRPARQRAATALVRREVPGLGRAEQRRLAAAIQVLTTASTWQALRDHWEMDGAEAGETAANAIALLLDGARARHP